MSLITTAQARNACMIEYTAQDVFLDLLIDGAEDYVERITGLKLSAATRVEYLNGGGYGLFLSHCPVNSVSEVYDVEAGSTESTDDYHLRRNAVYRDSGSRWDADPVNRWKVTYNGGCTSTDDRLKGLKPIILELIYRAFRTRGGQESHDAAGYSVDWEKFADSDMISKLKAYRTAASKFG